MEASGCCLVFNKNGHWLKDPDVSVPFDALGKMREPETSPDTRRFNASSGTLPLYQIAYIAYRDEYIGEEKCAFWLKENFGVRLKQVGKSQAWHTFRLEQLKTVLNKLIEACAHPSKLDSEDKRVLEYVRYLFKDFAFRDEEEFRILKMKEMGTDEVEYCEKTNMLFVSYDDVRGLVDEVILGTNYEKTNQKRKAEVFIHRMKKACPNVLISLSSLPINANLPIPKN